MCVCLFVCVRVCVCVLAHMHVYACIHVFVYEQNPGGMERVCCEMLVQETATDSATKRPKASQKLLH